MRVTEIFQDTDYANILSNFLKKKLEGNWVVDTDNGTVIVGTMFKGQPLNFRIESHRLGKTFMVETIFRAVPFEKEFKSIQEVLDYILKVASNPINWEHEAGSDDVFYDGTE